MIVFNIIFVVTFITKMLLHVYVARNNNNPIVASGEASSVELFWFYTKPVQIEYENMKKICNYLHVYNLVFFSILFIVGILRYIHII
jgi:hypothetical protein